MAAMLQEPNNKSYLLKNKIDFRKGNDSIVSRCYNMVAVNTLFVGSNNNRKISM